MFIIDDPHAPKLFLTETKARLYRHSPETRVVIIPDNINTARSALTPVELCMEQARFIDMPPLVENRAQRRANAKKAKRK